ncbi:MAG: NUDIX hydrolase [Pseudonocardiaceae bacterium]
MSRQDHSGAHDLDTNPLLLSGEFSHRDPVTAARLTAMREKIWTFIGRHAGGAQWRILWFAHTKYIVGVSGLVRNNAGQVLLIKGRMWKPSRPWGLVTGYAESGERWADTVVREAHEETGFEVKVEPNPVPPVTVIT